MITLPPWPVFEDDEIAAATEVLRSGRVNYWTGDRCLAFESAWSAMLGGRDCLAMANGSVSLDAAMRALGIGPGDEVIVSPRSYVASAMCVCLADATPVFADVCPESGCITPETAERARTDRTRAVIPVHVGGWPCDMPGFERWASAHGIEIIEDCAQAHGATVAGRPVGTWGRFASWSFCQDKIMTTAGEGGMLATPDRSLWSRCWSYAQHGKDRDLAAVAPDPGCAPQFRWLVNQEGTNLRMTELQAAVGLRQLHKLDGWVAARARNSTIMQSFLRMLPFLRVPRTPEGHAHYRCVAFVRATDGGAEPVRQRLLQALHSAGIPAMQGSCSEIYREPFFECRGLAPVERLPVARALGESSLTFLTHHTIGEECMRAYARRACEVMASAMRTPVPAER